MTASDSRTENREIGKIGKNSVHVSFMGTKLYHFEISIGCNAKIFNFCMVDVATRGDQG